MTAQRQFWAIAVLLVLIAFAFQGTRAIFEPDEGRYTATALNMLESGGTSVTVYLCLLYTSPSPRD